MKATITKCQWCTPGINVLNMYSVFNMAFLVWSKDPAFYIMFCEIPTATVTKHLHRVESPCQECLSAKVIMAPSL